MKRFKLLVVALATLSFTAFYACGGETDDQENVDSTEQVQDEPEVIKEETPDSTVMETPDSTEMEATETEEVVEEETK